MGVAAEIGQYLFGPAERRLGVDDPVDATEPIEMPGEDLGIGEAREFAKEAQIACIEGVLQVLQEQPAEQPREDAHWQEETGAASDPAGAIKGGPATRNNARDVRMMLQGLAPSVENHGHAELGAEMLGIGRDGGECLGRRAEKDRASGGLVLGSDFADR